MRYLILCLILSLFTFLSLTAQESTAPPARPSIAEVRFGDGSLVRMALLQESVEVKTKYGLLVIPINEIRKVEFGLHIDADVEKKIASCIKRLASDVYKERDAAGKELLQLERFAVPAVRKASQSGELEVATRAIILLEQLQSRIPPAVLKLPDHDVIHTADGPIYGRIVAQTLKANSPHFGDAALKLSELRAMNVRTPVGMAMINLDAAKYGSSLDQWRDSDIHVDVGLSITVTAEGQVDLWTMGPGQYIATPKGYNTAGRGGQFMAGALVGKIGENGKAFYIGDKYHGSTNEEGKLYLQIIPHPWGNNPPSGSYRVNIRTENK